MTRILVSKTAGEDLLAIWSYIALEDAAAADRVLDEIESMLDMLAKYPEVGRRDSGHTLRRFPVGQYVVFYQPVADGVQIVRVLHGVRFHDILL